MEPAQLAVHRDGGLAGGQEQAAPSASASDRQPLGRAAASASRVGKTSTLHRSRKSTRSTFSSARRSGISGSQSSASSRSRSRGTCFRRGARRRVRGGHELARPFGRPGASRERVPAVARPRRSRRGSDPGSSRPPRAAPRAPERWRRAPEGRVFARPPQRRLDGGWRRAVVVRVEVGRGRQRAFRREGSGAELLANLVRRDFARQRLGRSREAIATSRVGRAMGPTPKPATGHAKWRTRASRGARRIASEIPSSAAGSRTIAVAASRCGEVRLEHAGVDPPRSGRSRRRSR